MSDLKWINQKFKPSMLRSATETIGFNDFTIERYHNYALIWNPYKYDYEYYFIGKDESNNTFLTDFNELFDLDKTRKVLSEYVESSVNNTRKVKYCVWESGFATLDVHFDETFSKYGNVPICVIYHEAWSTFKETVSVYVEPSK